MRRLLPFFLISMLSVYALLAWAHDAEVDDLGCHDDPVTGGYHCHKGPLEGRDFVSRGEAEDALTSSAEQKADDKADEQSLNATAASSSGLKVISWNISKVGTERFENDRVANILSEGDIVALQEVEFSKTGETSLLVIAGLMTRRLNEKICKAWFKSSSGERGRHAFLWKESRIGYVEKTGEIREVCPEAPQVIAVDSKKIDASAVFHATFFHKQQKRMFVLASVHLPAKPKKTAKEIPALFKKLESQAWPTILTGNLKTSGKDKAFKDVLKMNFALAYGASLKSAPDVLWTKNLGVVRSEAIDLYERYPELSSEEVDKTVAGSFPLSAELTFSLEEAEPLKTELIKKPAGRNKSSVEEKFERETTPEPAPTQSMQNVHDDLESETQEAE